MGGKVCMIVRHVFRVKPFLYARRAESRRDCFGVMNTALPNLAFTPNAHPSLGVELELQLVDAHDMTLRSGFQEMVDALPESESWLKAELMQCYVEINTDVCQTVDDARKDLSSKLRRLNQAAHQADMRLLWAGTHPFSLWMEQKVTPKERYNKLVDSLQDIARRMVAFGMHVHVGVDSGDKAVMLTDRLMRYLSALLALSANSPFWVGRNTGLHSQRTKILEGLPAAGTPPNLRNYSEYCWVVNHSIQNGTINSIQEIWWDVRPHPKYGTIEVRVCDLPPNLEDALGLTALIQCLIAKLSEQIDEGVYQQDIHPLMVRQNKWKAARHGKSAEVIDPVSHKTIPVRDLIIFLYQNLEPIAERLGCGKELAHVLTMLERPNGAEKQLTHYHATNHNLPEVVRRMIGETDAML